MQAQIDGAANVDGIAVGNATMLLAHQWAQLMQTKMVKMIKLASQ